ncbi:hypothetical protein ACQUSR_17130 [Streptomyces sp. P1-3]|uniref:hypothetical protein n=1 Tax=Streptomyces sp. P1-3 TaxID=3421658 RepID=UPI003D36195F
MKKSRIAVLAGMAGLLVFIDSPAALAWSSAMQGARPGFESRTWTVKHDGSRASFRECRSHGRGPDQNTVLISMWENVPLLPDHRIGARARLSECFKGGRSSFGRDIPTGTSVYLRVDQVNGENQESTVDIGTIVVTE